MTAASRARFAQVVRTEPVDVGLAAALIAVEVDPGLDVDGSLATLDALAREAAAASALPPEQRLRSALAGYLGEVNAAGDAVDWDDLRSSLLPEVLKRRRGLPLLLCLVWVEVARRCGLEASYGAIPGRVVVVLDDRLAFDPYADEFLDGPVEPLTPHEVLLRLLTNIRALTMRQPPSLEVARTRLWAVELSLLLPVHPIELRRERGELLVRLGAHQRGAAELESYAAVVAGADAELAEVCLREARHARARLN